MLGAMNGNDDLVEEINEVLGRPELAQRIKKRAEALGCSPAAYLFHVARRDVAVSSERSAIRSIARERRKGP